MSSVFNYSTLHVEFFKRTRTIFATITLEDSTINTEFLFELESLLAWVQSKVEVNTIVINSNNDFFLKGPEQEDFKGMKEEQLDKLTQKLQKIVQAMMYLPQTVIFDLGNGASGMGAELALGADIRIASNQANLRFDHLLTGVTATCGGISLLSLLVGETYARNWLLTSKLISCDELIRSGLITNSYEDEARNDCMNSILENISEQAPVARIQTKNALLSNFREGFEDNLQGERKAFKTTLIAGDWKEKKEDFMKAKSFSHAVKLSLIKNQAEQVD